MSIDSSNGSQSVDSQGHGQPFDIASDIHNMQLPVDSQQHHLSIDVNFAEPVDCFDVLTTFHPQSEFPQSVTWQ